MVVVAFSAVKAVDEWGGYQTAVYLAATSL
jgi:hypothetical protein